MYFRGKIMQYRTVPKTGDRPSAFGYGFKRLPHTGTRGIDKKRAIRQPRSAIDRGVNYVDTAPACHFGRSEAILSRALAGGYREKARDLRCDRGAA
jgi:predicted aldo/keto reductase-like oxidoreductase